MKKIQIVALLTVGFIMLQSLGNKSYTQPTNEITETTKKQEKKVAFGYHSSNYKHPNKAKKAAISSLQPAGQVVEKSVSSNYKKSFETKKQAKYAISNKINGRSRPKNYKMPNN